MLYILPNVVFNPQFQFWLLFISLDRFTNSPLCFAQAQSGTGKTGTFTIGVLQSIDIASANCQALIVAPTRELSAQTAFVVHSIGEYMNVKVHACVGGTVVREDIRILKSGVHVVVGTPGRIHDMMKRGFMKTDYLKLFILDEADEMLSRGFK